MQTQFNTQKNTYNKTNIMKLYISLILLFISTITLSQNNDKLEKIKALRVAFISTKLELTSNEAQKFWPIFNEFDKNQTDLRKEKRMLMMKLKHQNTSSLSDIEMQKLLDTSELLESNIQTNRQQLVKNLKGVISPQKIILLKQLEEDFKKTLLKQMRNSKNN